LIESVGRTCAGLADKRRGKNSQFSMRDIGLAGIAPFFMQSSSFLSHQRQICEGIGHGRSNCQTLLGMGDIPTDNHIRTMLDDVEPSSLFGLFDEVVFSHRHGREHRQTRQELGSASPTGIRRAAARWSARRFWPSA
jgi:hypothetical protein